MHFRKNLVSALLLATLSLNAQAQQVPEGLSGVWWNPDASGMGLVVEHVEFPTPGKADQLQAYWYTYDASGNPIYLVGSGDYVRGSAGPFPLFSTRGGRPGTQFNPAQVERAQWGTATITGLTCEQITLAFTPSGGTSGSVQLRRLATDLGGAPVASACAMVTPPAPLGRATAQSCAGVFGCSSTTLPFQGGGSSQLSQLPTPALFNVRTFRITAQGGDVLVNAASVVSDSHPSTIASISGVQAGTRIPSGSTVDVHLQTASTRGVQENITYVIALEYTGHSGTLSNPTIRYQTLVSTN